MKLNIGVLLFLLLTAAGYGKWIELSNDYIKIGVDNDTGRLTLSTVEGDVSISFDNFKDLLYSKTPPTSFTTLSINDEYFIFGSDSGYFKQRPFIEGNKIITEWVVRDIDVIQEAGITKGASTGLEDTMLISYKIANKTGRTIKIGARIVLDTVLDDIEPKEFGIPGAGNISKETLLSHDGIPGFWYAFDDYSNPILRTVGTFKGEGVVKPDRVIFAAWDRFYDNKWDFSVDSSRDFRRQGTAQMDSAVALFYDPVEKGKDEMRQINTMYGVYGTSVFTGDDMFVSMSVPMELKGPPVPVAVDFNNHSKNPLDRLQIEIIPPQGFKLSPDETNMINYVKVNSGESKKMLWNLTGLNTGGTYNVRIKATGWINEVSQSIEVDKDFSIVSLKTNIKQNIVTEKPVVQVETPVTTVHETLPETVIQKPNPALSEQERKLLMEINELDELISQISKKYEIMMGVYKNLYTTNNSYILDADSDIKNFQSALEEEEEKLSDEMSILRD